MLTIKFNPFPQLSTRRLVLRQLIAADENNIFFLRSDEEVNKYVDRPKARSLQDAADFINKINAGIAADQSIFWVITIDNEFAGTICLWNINAAAATAEVGYELLPLFQRKGIMREALSAIIDYAFNTMQLSAIDACFQENNQPSLKLLEHYNFKKDIDSIGKLEQEEIDNGMLIYSLRYPSVI